MYHRANEFASAPIGHPTARNDVAEDPYILPIWTVSGFLLTAGLSTALGPGGFFIGLGVSGLFFFLGMVVEAATARNRQ